MHCSFLGARLTLPRAVCSRCCLGLGYSRSWHASGNCVSAYACLCVSAFVCVYVKTALASKQHSHTHTHTHTDYCATETELLPVLLAVHNAAAPKSLFRMPVSGSQSSLTSKGWVALQQFHFLLTSAGTFTHVHTCRHTNTPPCTQVAMLSEGLYLATTPGWQQLPPRQACLLQCFVAGQQVCVRRVCNRNATAVWCCVSRPVKRIYHIHSKSIFLG